MADTPTTAVQLREVLGEEWSSYVATTSIDIGGARAFNEGDPVPKSHVDNKVVQGWQVAKRGTKAADAAVSPSTDENLKG